MEIEINNKFRKFLNKYPSAIVLTALLSGILIYMVFKEGSKYLYLFSFLITFFLAYIVYVKNKILSRALLCFFLGLSITFLSYYSRSNELTNLVPESVTGAVIKFKVTDPSCSAENIPWLDSPFLMRAELISIKFSPHDKAKITSADIFIKTSRCKMNFIYGQKYKATGSFLNTDSLSSKSFNMNNYLMSRKISRVFEPLKDETSKIYRKTNNEKNLLYPFIKVRDNIMLYLSNGLKKENKQILAAILFACRQNLGWKNKENFLNSGTIHIFAVSGLHVGMLAFFLLIILRPLPFRIRYLIIPALLLAYVLTTGSHSSALRAMIMISLFSLHRAFLYKTDALNYVISAAFLLLLFNPFAFLDIGFQYSFIITGFLIGSWQNMSKWFLCLDEKRFWTPSKNFSFIRNSFSGLRKKALQAVGGCSVAWLSGSPLTLFYRGFFIPGAVFANFALIPFVWFLFLSVFIKLIFFPLKFINLHLVTPLIAFFICSVQKISSFFAEFSAVPLRSPPLIAILIFYFMMLPLLFGKNKKIILTSFLFCYIFVSLCFVNFHNKNSLLWVANGRFSSAASIILLNTENNESFFINASTPEAIEKLSEKLKSKGIHKIKLLIFSDPLKRNMEGAFFLINHFQVEKVLISSKFRRSTFAKMLIEKIKNKNIPVIIKNSLNDNWSFKKKYCHVKKNGDSFKLEYSHPNSKVHIQILRNRNYGDTVKISSPNSEKSKIIKVKKQEKIQTENFKF